MLAALDLAACLALGLAMMRERPPGVVPAGRGDPSGRARLNLVSAAVDRPTRPALVAAETRDQQDVLAALRVAATAGRLEVYGPFWTADMQTHLSDGRFQVVEVVCGHRDRLRRRLWLTDTARERVRASRAAVIVPRQPRS